MDLTVVYLLRRFLYRIFEFLRHWYAKSLFLYSHWFFNFLERLDKFFALKVTLHHLFQPLYKDYSLIGYVLGFFFRLGRIAVSSLSYLVIIILAILFYLLWLVAPIFIVYRIAV